MATGLFWQYKQFTDLNNFVNAFSSYIDNYKLVNIANIDNSFGYSLDILAKIIGIEKRPVVYNWQGFTWDIDSWDLANWGTSNAESYQFIADTTLKNLIKARLFQLLTTRTLDNFLKTIEIMLPNLTYTYSENLNEFVLNYNLLSINKEDKAILTGGYLLLPQGCILTLNEVI